MNSLITYAEASAVFSIYCNIVHARQGKTLRDEPLENRTREGHDLVFTYDEVDEFIDTAAWPLQIEWAANFELGRDNYCARAGRELRDFCERCGKIVDAHNELIERKREAMIVLDLYARKEVV